MKLLRVFMKKIILVILFFTATPVLAKFNCYQLFESTSDQTSLDDAEKFLKENWSEILNFKIKQVALFAAEIKEFVIMKDIIDNYKILQQKFGLENLDINARTTNAWSMSVLDITVQEQDVDAVRFLVKRGAAVTDRTFIKEVVSGNLEILDLILTGVDASITHTHYTGEPILITAVGSKKIENVKVVLSHYPPEKLTKKELFWPLDGALSTEQLNMAKLFYDLGARLDESVISAMSEAIMEDKNLDVIRLIYSYEPTYKPVIFETAIASKDPVMVKELINLGYKVNDMASYDYTYLGYAVSRNAKEIVRLLIGEHAYVNKLDIHQRTPLDLAMNIQADGYDMKEIIDILIKAGGIRNQKN
jgi:hypothetical protein